MFDLIKTQKLLGKLSVSNQISKKHGNCTYGFHLVDFDFEKPLNFNKLGFASWVFKDGHRTKDNMTGMTNLGYIDIDLPIVEDGKAYTGPRLTKEDIIRAMEGKAFYLAKSKSQIDGKFRLIYKREFTMEDNLLISNGIVLGKYEHAGEVCVNINQEEADKFLELLPEAKAFIDKTSFDYHMHSKNLGQFLHSQEGDALMEMQEHNLERLKETDENTQDRINYQTSIEGSFKTDTNLCYFKLIKSKKNQVFERGGNKIKGDAEYYRWVGGSTLPINDGSGLDKIHILQLFDRRQYWIDDSKIGGIPERKHRGNDAFMQFKSFGIQNFGGKDSITFWSAGVHNSNLGFKLMITFDIVDEVWVEDASLFNHIRTDDGDFWADSKSMTIYRRVMEFEDGIVKEENIKEPSRKINLKEIKVKTEVVILETEQNNIQEEVIVYEGAPKLGTKYRDVVLEESDFFHRKPKKWINGRWI